MRVDKTGPSAAWRGLPRVTGTSDDFAQFMQADAAAPDQAGEAASSGAIDTSPIVTSAAPADATARDRDARRHGNATLRALASAQAALLGGASDAARQSLAVLVRTAPSASDPGLAAVLRAIAVRAAVELARDD